MRFNYCKKCKNNKICKENHLAKFLKNRMIDKITVCDNFEYEVE